jgi:hypothetical protein
VISTLLLSLDLSGTGFAKSAIAMSLDKHRVHDAFTSFEVTCSNLVVEANDSGSLEHMLEKGAPLKEDDFLAKRVCLDYSKVSESLTIGKGIQGLHIRGLQPISGLEDSSVYEWKRFKKAPKC